MATQIWLLPPSQDRLYSADQVAEIGAVQNSDQTWSWALYDAPNTAASPMYLTSQKFPTAIAAIQAGLDAMIVNLP